MAEQYGLGGRFDRLFRSERSWLIKIGGAGLFGFLTASLIVAQNSQAFSLAAKVATLAAVPGLIMLGAALLLRADAVRRQLRAGSRVGLFSRALFGAGIWSLLIWLVLALLTGFPIAIWIGSMTAGQPAG